MSNKLFLATLALALPLSACGGADDTTVVEPVDTMAPADPMATDPMATDAMAPSGTMAGDVTVDGTVAAAGSDLTAMDLTTAGTNVDQWLAKLNDPAVEFDQKNEIVNGLQELKGELAAMPLDGSAIGETLADLGDETTTAAATASSSSQAGLRTLGSALTAAGQKLGGSSMIP